VILLGAHFSIANGLHQAIHTARDYGCNTLQIFTKNASTWKERDITKKEIDLFNQAREEAGIESIFSHDSYLINLASPEEKKYRMSKRAMLREINRCALLQIPFLVMHPGSHRDSGEVAGMIRIADGINAVLDKAGSCQVRILLETTAGQGSSLGRTFEELAFIIEKVEDKNRIGVCLDTCHIFAAGYDIRTKASYLETIESFDRILGLKNLHLIHLNDSKKGLGSRMDRHEHIGEGAIGEDGFRFFLNDSRLDRLPFILETPKEKDGIEYDQTNLNRVRRLAGEEICVKVSPKTGKDV